MKKIILILIFSSFSNIATSKPMLHRPFVADLSDHLIKIDTSFSGSEVLLFGARNDPGDIIAIIRGPKKPYVVRKKKKIFGIWVNGKQHKFHDVDSFYTIASSKPLEIIRNEYIFKNMSIGLNNLDFINKSEENNHFKDALLQYKIETGLYSKDIIPIDFIGNALFRIKLKIPENIAPGIYSAEVYLFNNGQMKGLQTTPIHIKKTGLDSIIFHIANDYSILYGIFSVLLALFVGWLVGWIFRKRP